ncbi:MAG: hypothetical protein M1827_001084 [Pycnora praestabilis]|nr:MAG: hypothetical protein M1827_001084 [Pycnora praestabilis]
MKYDEIKMTGPRCGERRVYLLKEIDGMEAYVISRAMAVTVASVVRMRDFGLAVETWLFLAHILDVSSAYVMTTYYVIEK